jgi:branched-chain amino acid transport system permease protein
VVAGSFLFVALSEALRISPDIRMIAYGVLLVVVVFACPEGILPLLLRKVRRKPAIRPTGESAHVL